MRRALPWSLNHPFIYLFGSNWYNAILVEEGCQSGRLGRSRKPLWPYGPPWVRIPPPPLIISQSITEYKKPDGHIVVRFFLFSHYVFQEALSLVLLTLKMNDIARNPTPTKRMIKDCQASGLNIGPIILRLASINS